VTAQVIRKVEAEPLCEPMCYQPNVSSVTGDCSTPRPAGEQRQLRVASSWSLVRLATTGEIPAHQSTRLYALALVLSHLTRCDRGICPQGPSLAAK
jgi:hypothetical protein